MRISELAQLAETLHDAQRQQLQVLLDLADHDPNDQQKHLL